MDGKRIYVSENIPGMIKILTVELESKEAKALFSMPFDLERGRPGYSYVTMTSDAKKFVFPTLKTQSDIWVIENFDQIIE